MKFLILLLLSLTLQAKLLLSPFDAMTLNFGENVDIQKKNILLNNAQAKEVQTLAQSKLNTKIYRIFRAYQDEKVIGYGILVLHKVRSKDTAVLSIITPDGVLKGIEIIAFNEPTEYLPSQNWVKLFKHKTLSPELKVGKAIPSISGSTLSARAATKASRIALALFEVMYKK